jgi:hypothetical protein
VPLAPLVLACYGPDWAELVFGLAYGRGTMQVLAHSLPAVLVGGLSAAGLFALVAHRHGARYLLLGWLLHWPADFLTARKPLIDLDHRVGLDLYHRPAIDFLLEGALLVVCCAIYARVFARDTVQRRWVVAMAAALLGMQAVLDYGLRSEPQPWNPVLVHGLWRPHPKIVSICSVPGSDPHGSCTLAQYRHSERAMATNRPRGVTTLICLSCGKEKFFTQEVPAAVVCDQCGSTVFRTFTTPTEPDEAVIDALEAQARSIAYGDSSPATTVDDVRDLDAR